MVIEALLDRFGTKAPKIFYTSDSDGLGIELLPEDWTAAIDGKADELTAHRYLTMQLLLEEGLALPIKNGIYMDSENAVRLGIDERALFDLPTEWPYQMVAEVEGRTWESDFRITLALVSVDGSRITNYTLDGPLLAITKQETYLPSPEQFSALQCAAFHAKTDASERGEYENLSAVREILEAKAAGANLSAPVFDALDLVVPGKIGVTVEVDRDGDLELTPSFGTQIDTEEIKQRLVQLKNGEPSGSLRIGRRILLLDEKRMAAIQEILISSSIEAKDRKTFLSNPTAWLDASLVDLDSGFSFRVKGAGPLKLAYFGDHEDSGVGWFEAECSREKNEQVELIQVEPQDLVDLIQNEDDLTSCQKRISEGVAAGAEEIRFKGKLINISDPAALAQALDTASEKLEGTSVTEKPSPDDLDDPTVLDIETNDEALQSTPEIARPGNVRFNGVIEFDAYKRTPFPHQEEAIRWLLGIAVEPWAESGALRGSLLADDMGLGKTYTAIVFIAEYLKHLSESKAVTGPVLIVAPLVLLETWKREIEVTYVENPFKQIVVLHSQADLPNYRVSGAKNEMRMNRGASTGGGTEPDLNRGSEMERNALLDSIRYALKIGATFGGNRLDLPNSIVVTTFQTLRDYQFSLARVDWSVVVFDEAQNIKNPNAMQTRAAKALKASYKLMMTGTPVENHLGEFWCLIDTCLPGLLGTYQDFRKEYVKPLLGDGDTSLAENRKQIGKRLREDVDGFMLRRLKEDELEGLPKKIIHRAAFDTMESEVPADSRLVRVMDGSQLDRYNTVLTTTIAALEQEDGRGQALAGIGYLRQVVLHPDLVGDGNLVIPTSKTSAQAFMKTSGKLDSLLDILTDISLANEKALVFLINKKMQQALSAALRQLFGCSAAIVNGDTKTFSTNKPNKTRQGLIDSFEAREGFDVLLMSPVAAGVGLTINAANHVIHLERHWNPAKEAQATDRAYRIGQNKDVHVYYPVVLHPELESFDLKLNRLIESKVSLKDAVIAPEEVHAEELLGSGLFGDHKKAAEQPLTMPEVHKLSWEFFEAFVAELHVGEGYETVELTPTSNDFGCDVVAISSTKPSRLIQVKYTEKSTLLNAHLPITEIYGSQPHYERKFGKAFEELTVFTNAVKYVSSAKKAAKGYNVRLFASKDIEKMLKRCPVKMSSVIKRHNTRQSTSI